MEVLEKVVNWLFFNKFGFAECTGFEYIFLGVTTIGIIVVICSKKIRNKFF